MMNAKKIIVVFVMFIFAMLAVHAQSNKALFTDQKDGTLSVKNDTSTDIILFAGKVEKGNVLGGVRAKSERKFDLTKLQLPAKNGAFILRGISDQSYQKKKMFTDDDIVYTGLVIFDLTDPNRKQFLTIFSELGGNGLIYVSNDSMFVLELRIGQPAGEKLVAIPPFQRMSKIFVNPEPTGMPYTLFPSYVYIDPTSNEDSTMVDPERKRVTPEIGGNVMHLNFTGPKIEDKSPIRLLFE